MLGASMERGFPQMREFVAGVRCRRKAQIATASASIQIPRNADPGLSSAEHRSVWTPSDPRPATVPLRDSNGTVRTNTGAAHGTPVFLAFSAGQNSGSEVSR